VTDQLVKEGREAPAKNRKGGSGALMQFGGNISLGEKEGSPSRLLEAKGKLPEGCGKLL